MSRFDRLQKYFVTHPQRIFLVDAVGALFSFLLLYTVLRNLDEYFRMPGGVIKLLYIIALTLFCFSGLAFYLSPSNWKVFLRIVITGNIFYCLFTVGVVFRNSTILSIYDLAYFIVECGIIVMLVWFEIQLLVKHHK